MLGIVSLRHEGGVVDGRGLDDDSVLQEVVDVDDDIEDRLWYEWFLLSFFL